MVVHRSVTNTSRCPEWPSLSLRAGQAEPVVVSFCNMNPTSAISVGVSKRAYPWRFSKKMKVNALKPPTVLRAITEDERITVETDDMRIQTIGLGLQMMVQAEEAR